MSRHVSRRFLLGTTARSLPALAVGGGLLGSSLDLLAAPKKYVDDGKVAGPDGESTLITDFQLRPGLRVVAEASLKKLRAGFAAAAANPDKKLAKNKLTGASQRFIAAQKGVRVGRAKSRAGLLLGDAGRANKELGGWAATRVDQWQADKGLDLMMKNELKAVKWSEVEVELAKIKKEKKIKREKHDPNDYAAKPVYQKLEFHLNTVRCREETSGESGSDEILLGGQLIRPDGIIKQIDRFKVSDDFDAGEVRYYDSAKCIDAPSSMRPMMEEIGVCNGHYSDPYRGKVLVRTNLDGPWPGTYGLILMMVEEDYGGFGTFLQELYDQTKEDIDRGLGEVGSEAGRSISDDEMGEVIGQVIAWVLSAFVEWLANLFDNPDDPVATKSWVLTLENRTKEWFDARTAGGLSAPGGERASKMKKIDFNGDGGKYRARLHFRALS